MGVAGIISCSPTTHPQGDTGKAGAPGEVGLQGLPVSMTFDPELSCLLDWIQLSELLYCVMGVIFRRACWLLCRLMMHFLHF